MLFKELPENEKPRERLLKYGAQCLSDLELIEILIRNGTSKKDVRDISLELLNLDDRGLVGLCNLTLEELQAVEGVGLAKACQIATAFEIAKRLSTRPRDNKISASSVKEVVDLFMEDMRYLNKEYMKILLLNAKCEIISIENIGIGDLHSVLITPREVFNIAIKKSAAAVVLVHNHPSGDPSPSVDDENTTIGLKKAAEIIGINLIDHIIIGDGKYFSFREHSLDNCS